MNTTSTATSLPMSSGPTEIETETCQHCGGPRQADASGTSSAFCCPGCETAYHTLAVLGLQHFYSLRAESRAKGVQVLQQGTDPSLFDSEGFSTTHVEILSPTHARVHLLLHGIHCVGCVWILEQLPRLVPGVIQASLSFSEGLLSVQFDPTSVKLSKIVDLLMRLGYPARPYTAADRIERQREENKDFLLRLGVAGFGFGNTMVIASSLYQGYFTGIDADIRTFMHWVSMVIAFPVILYAGRPFFASLASSLHSRRIHMDVPIAIGITAIFSYSAWNTFVGAERVYFDSVCALLFLLLLGRYFQHRALQQANRSMRDEFEVLPISAKVRRGDADLSVPQWDIRPTDLVLVDAGARVPIDGTIEYGSSSFNTAVMTGESHPQLLSPSAAVFAGFLNLERAVAVRPSASPEGTRLHKLLQLLDQGAMHKTPLVESAERILGWFVLAVLSAAGLTFLFWIPSGAQAALDASVALLVVCCPCALALATPLALATGVRRGAACGILIRRADVIERSTRIKRIFFDKTGTLTSGNLKVEKEIVATDAPRIARDIAFQLASAGAYHPASRAIVRFLEISHPTRSTPATAIHNSQVVSGAGVRGVDAQGIEWRLGSDTFALLSPRSSRPPGMSSHVILSRDGHLVAEFIVSDSIAPATHTALESLRNLDISISILSGDLPSTTTAVGAALGLPAQACVGGASPEEKLIRLKAAGTGTMMVGDGINDAAALGAADVGVAVRGDALRCLESSDVALLERGIEGVPELIRGSRRVVRIIHENLGLSLLYNVVGAGLAMGGYVDPLMAAFLMPLSSLTVLANSYLRKTFTRPIGM